MRVADHRVEASGRHDAVTLASHIIVPCGPRKPCSLTSERICRKSGRRPRRNGIPEIFRKKIGAVVDARGKRGPVNLSHRIEMVGVVHVFRRVNHPVRGNHTGKRNESGYGINLPDDFPGIIERKSKFLAGALLVLRDQQRKIGVLVSVRILTTNVSMLVAKL